MNTLIGLVVGVIATVAVGHHYFRRTTRKSLGIYQILISQIFAGIEREVRDQLRFTYQDRDVQNLLQLQFLIANDGERAISNVIEPLKLDLPDNVELLDASVLHRHPRNLEAIISTEEDDGSGRAIRFNFPLLNKGDFFLVKLLLSGEISHDDLSFSALADDLPRTLTSSWLPPTAFEEHRFRLAWGPLAIGVGVAGIAGWLVWVLRLLHAHRPEVFPFPWGTYVFSIDSIPVLAPALVLLLVLVLLALVLIIMGGFDDFPPTGPRFPLPKELRKRGFHYPFPRFADELETESRATEDATKSSKTHPAVE